MTQINYLLQIISLPEDLKEASQDMQSDLYSTYTLYKMLIDTQLLWRVWYIDEYDQTWLEVNFMNNNKEPEFHTIVIDEGTYTKIEVDPYHILDCLE